MKKKSKFIVGDYVMVIESQHNDSTTKKYIGFIGQIKRVIHCKTEFYGGIYEMKTIDGKTIDVCDDELELNKRGDKYAPLDESKQFKQKRLSESHFTLGAKVCLKFEVERLKGYKTRVGHVHAIEISETNEFIYTIALHDVKGTEVVVDENEIILYNENPNDQRIPNYYKGKKGMEARDVIWQFDLSYNVGTATTYLLRAGKKKEAGMDDIAKHIEDLQKAINHLTFEIDNLKSNQ